jgi:rare lipoprotein A
MKINTRNIRAYFRFSAVGIISLTLLVLVGCSSHKKYSPLPELVGYRETGIASYYAAKYQFRKTASGERLNNNAMTAAHRSLPFGTRVIVTNLNNGKTVKVRINDRGPFVKGRIIDLTRAAFAKIEDYNKGLAEVEIRVID